MFQHNQIEADCRLYRFHFIGIGGIGMSGLALLLVEQGHQISGSDLKENYLTERLVSKGAQIFVGHHQENLSNADFVVVSSAIDWSNPEVIKAQSLGIPLIKRGRLLADLMHSTYGISVAGTHGKTTTSSLLSHMFISAKRSPTYVIGGCLNDTQRNALKGDSKYFICEADESDNSFVELSPVVSIITNIDADHMETFGGNMSCLEASFDQYCHKVPFNGLVVLGIDDLNVQRLANRYQGTTITYGVHTDADITAKNIMQEGLRTRFSVAIKKSNLLFECEIPLPGEHNVQNALACIATCLNEKMTVEEIQQGLSSFPGVGRRAQVISSRLFGENVTVIDDYGHHPCEIEATHVALKAAWPERRLVWVFQPHRYSRTQFQFAAYIDCLSKIQHLILLDVFPAGEAEIEGATSADLAQAVAQKTGDKPLVWKDLYEMSERLKEIIKPNDVVIFQGAGSVSSWAKELLTCQSKVA
ncbi:MAG: UDP-N-acetylmuramate--L-alanine ligase [Legionellales bacterium]|nr:UDP-N-acetylmuramate--L-alanine ligase [Legionellales bacterium]